jgi:AcrR family transcriptional regulator
MTAPALSPQLRPRKVPRQQRALETRARILDAARAVFEEHGYARGTTNRIAEAAGLSVGSFYQYFPNKDAILVELVDAHIDAGTEAVTAAMVGAGVGPTTGRAAGCHPSLDALVRPVVDAMVRLHATDASLHRVLFEEAPRPPEQLARLRALERDLTDLLAGVLADHPEVRTPDPRVAARLVIDVIESLVHRIATDTGSGIAPDVLADEITHMVVAYLRTPRP